MWLAVMLVRMPNPSKQAASSIYSTMVQDGIKSESAVIASFKQTFQYLWIVLMHTATVCNKPE